MGNKVYIHRLFSALLTLALFGSASCVRVYVPFGAHSSTASEQLTKEGDSTVISQRLNSANSLIIDARSPSEFDEKHYPGAINIPHDSPSIDTTALGSNLDRPVLIYCRSGKRAELLRTRLLALGYSNTINGGGLEELQNKK
jgi:phage shock protein E